MKEIKEIPDKILIAGYKEVKNVVSPNVDDLKQLIHKLEPNGVYEEKLKSAFFLGICFAAYYYENR